MGPWPSKLALICNHPQKSQLQNGQNNSILSNLLVLLYSLSWLGGHNHLTGQAGKPLRHHSTPQSSLFLKLTPVVPLNALEVILNSPRGSQFCRSGPRTPSGPLLASVPGDELGSLKPERG